MWRTLFQKCCKFKLILKCLEKLFSNKTKLLSRLKFKVFKNQKCLKVLNTLIQQPEWRHEHVLKTSQRKALSSFSEHNRDFMKFSSRNINFQLNKPCKLNCSQNPTKIQIWPYIGLTKSHRGDSQPIFSEFCQLMRSAASNARIAWIA